MQFRQSSLARGESRPFSPRPGDDVDRDDVWRALPATEAVNSLEARAHAYIYIYTHTHTHTHTQVSIEQARLESNIRHSRRGSDRARRHLTRARHVAYIGAYTYSLSFEFSTRFLSRQSVIIWGAGAFFPWEVATRTGIDSRQEKDAFFEGRARNAVYRTRALRRWNILWGAMCGIVREVKCIAWVDDFLRASLKFRVRDEGYFRIVNCGCRWAFCEEVYKFVFNAVVIYVCLERKYKRYKGYTLNRWKI